MANYRIDPFTGVVTPKAIVNEVVTVPGNSPFYAQLSEVPEKATPSTISARVCDFLTAPITVTTSPATATVAHGSWFSNGQTLTIDNEKLLITAVSGNNLTVTRAQGGTTAATHVVGSMVYIENSMTEATSPPGAGQFMIDYTTEADDNPDWNTGKIVFNSALANKMVAFSYNGLGSLADERALCFKIAPGFKNFGNEQNGHFISTGNFTLGAGTFNYKSFTLLAGHTMTLTYPGAIIRCTGTVTIAGTIEGTGKGSPGAPRTTTPGNGNPGNPGYGGGGSGNGGIGNNAAQAGGPGAISYVGYGSMQNVIAAAIGSTPATVMQEMVFDFCAEAISFPMGAGGGSGGFSNIGYYGGAGGPGGGGLIIIADKIVFTGTINLKGGNAETDNWEGGGGGGGGGVCIIVANQIVTDSGVINVQGGTPGSRGAAGAAGWWKKFILSS